MAVKIDFTGKNALIMGIKNNESIAWRVALLLLQAGASVFVPFHRDSSKARLEKILIPSLPAEQQGRIHIAGKCDVASDEDIISLFSCLKERAGTLDFLVHSVASAANLDMIINRKFLDITQEEMLKTIQITAVSLISIAREFAKLANQGASIVSISYYGSRQVVPEYACLAPAKAALESIVQQIAYALGKSGIRANTVVAPAVLTTSAKPFPHIEDIIKYQEESSPLGVKITQEMIAETVFLLLADFARAITGQLIYSDAGFSILAPHF